jgi:ATP-dependent RNA helicase SUPV3L1/SUV3
MATLVALRRCFLVSLACFALALDLRLWSGAADEVEASGGEGERGASSSESRVMMKPDMVRGGSYELADCARSISASEESRGGEGEAIEATSPVKSSLRLEISRTCSLCFRLEFRGPQRVRIPMLLPAPPPRSLSLLPLARAFSAAPLARRAASQQKQQHSKRQGNSHYARSSPPHTHRQRYPGANSRGGGGAAGRGRPGPSSIATPQLVSKLEHHLEQVWAKHGAPARSLRQLATDLGVDVRTLARLANQFAHAAQPTLPGAADGDDLQQQSSGIEWDLDAIRAAYIADGPDALFNATLATFLAWLRVHVPLPTPTRAHPLPDPGLSKLHQLAAIADRRFAYEDFPDARQRRRRLILHVGPTNSGKTHSALVALARARTGAYAGPLRLLAHEVFARFNEGKIGDEGKRTCNLVTGEEQRILDPDAGLQSCTVEMFPLSKRLDVGVVDEIQMIGDPQRGTAWTSAVIGALCDELHLCGEESVVDLVQKIAAELGDECVVKRYQRLSPLVVADSSLGGDLSRIRKGDCLVTFSRSNIFAFKRAVEEKTGLRVAVAYGGLPPEVREEQARAFNEGSYDVLVASDAVGMGLNLYVVTYDPSSVSRQ